MNKKLKFVLILIAIAAILPLWVDLSWLGRPAQWSSPLLSLLNSACNNFGHCAGVFVGSLLARLLDPAMMLLSIILTMAICSFTNK